MKNFDLYSKLSSLYNDVLVEFFENKVYNNFGHLIIEDQLLLKLVFPDICSSHGGNFEPVIEPHLLN